MPAALLASSVSLRATPLRAANRRVASKSAVRSAVVAPRAMASQDELKKLVLKMMSSFIVIFTTLGLLLVFYTEGNISCSWCHNINCINYSEGMCDTTAVDEEQSNNKALDLAAATFYRVIGSAKW